LQNTVSNPSFTLIVRKKKNNNNKKSQPLPTQTPPPLPHAENRHQFRRSFTGKFNLSLRQYPLALVVLLTQAIPLEKSTIAAGNN
jgi:hypothetical protein